MEMIEFSLGKTIDGFAVSCGVLKETPAKQIDLTKRE
jgi:hypothetical protein